MDDTSLHILSMIFAAGAVYGAIRADIKAMRVEIETGRKTADKAHERIDAILNKGH